MGVWGLWLEKKNDRNDNPKHYQQWWEELIALYLAIYERRIRNCQNLEKLLTQSVVVVSIEAGLPQLKKKNVIYQTGELEIILFQDSVRQQAWFVVSQSKKRIKDFVTRQFATLRSIILLQSTQQLPVEKFKDFS